MSRGIQVPCNHHRPSIRGHLRSQRAGLEYPRSNVVLPIVDAVQALVPGRVQTLSRREQMNRIYIELDAFC